MSKYQMRSNQKYNIQLISLILVFTIPVILSWFLYTYHTRFHFKTTNHGTLINPPIPLANLIKSENKWLILYAPAGICAKECITTQQLLNNIKLALGKNSKRVNVILADPTTQAKLATLFKQHKQTTFTVTQKIYLIDPANNVFMYYPSDTNPMNILKDLKRVLEVSQIG